MKEMLRGPRDAGAALSGLASAFGLAVPQEALRALQAFATLFETWNRSINLASLRSPDELVTRHFADSFALASLLEHDAHAVIDVGSGGGLPAIPLAVLAPSLQIDLFEPNRKKAAFLRTAIRELGQTGRLRVHTESVPNPPMALAAKYDLAMSRATLAPPEWLDLGRQLVPPSGRVAVFAAAQSDATLPAAARSLAYGEGRRLLLFAGG